MCAGPSKQCQRSLLEITRSRKEIASTNALLEVRMVTAPGLTQLLEDAPRIMLSPESLAAADAGCNSWEQARCNGKIPPAQFDNDAAELFNTWMPLSLWIDAAKQETLPEHLRGTLALSAWLRALILGRDADARALMAVLPAQIQTSLARSDDPTGFAATLVLLHSPGLSLVHAERRLPNPRNPLNFVQ